MAREFDLLDGSWYARQPYDDWAWMREHAPVYWDATNKVWALTRYNDVLAVEKDAATYSSHRAPRPHGDHLPMMISMDDPEHVRRRKLVSRGFTPRRVRDHEATIQRICTHIIDGVAPTGSCDFVWDIAAPLPLLLIADMLGFPPDAYDDLLRWSDDLIRATTIDPSPEIADAGFTAMLQFREFQLRVIADRRAKPPQDDLVSILCYAEIDGEGLDDESIISESLLILIGGDETSRHVMTDGMLALLEHPDQLAILRDDRDRIDVGVEELLRWVSPIKNMARTVTRDVELREQTLHQGDQVILMYPSANRDAAVFDDPDRFDVQRDPNPHLAFGFGPHFCMGASLARIELKTMFTELLRRLPDLHLAGDPLPRRSSNFISGPETMPVAFTPVQNAAVLDPALAERVAAKLKARGDTVAVAEGSCGGLISASLLAIPGASTYFVGGSVIYTRTAKDALYPRIDTAKGMRGATEEWAIWLARAARDRMGTTWGIGEGGAAGPTNPYGDPAGHAWFAVAGPGDEVRTRHVLTGIDDRPSNMVEFTKIAIALLEQCIDRL